VDSSNKRLGDRTNSSSKWLGDRTNSSNIMLEDREYTVEKGIKLNIYK
jgi:hypothetical protein